MTGLPHPLTDCLARQLQLTFAPEQLQIDDQSHLHAGHSGSQGGGRHYKIEISSPRLSQLSTVAAHRAIYQSVASLMVQESPHPSASNSYIHALSIQITPSAFGA